MPIGSGPLSATPVSVTSVFGQTGIVTGGTATDVTNIIGNAGSAAMLYVEADDAGQPYALEVGGSPAGDVLIVIPDNANLGHTRVIVVDGFVLQSANAALASGDLNSGDCSLWFDSTIGASKLMVKAKQADGTVKTAAIALS